MAVWLGVWSVMLSFVFFFCREVCLQWYCSSPAWPFFLFGMEQPDIMTCVWFGLLRPWDHHCGRVTTARHIEGMLHLPHWDVSGGGMVGLCGCGVTSSQQTLGEHLWASTHWFSENHTFIYTHFLIFCEGYIINCVVMISKHVLVAVMLWNVPNSFWY